MRRHLAIVLLIVLHVQPSVNISIWIDYLANNEYIREALCINKEEPKLACNGKCHVMKQLQENQSEQEQELPKLLQSKYEFVFLINQDQGSQDTTAEPLNHNFLIYCNNYSHLMDWGIFHPPQS
ncbi:MAG: hypothetical protein AAF901_01205 [Bacteroidota bacterium]